MRLESFPYHFRPPPSHVNIESGACLQVLAYRTNAAGELCLDEQLDSLTRGAAKELRQSREIASEDDEQRSLPIQPPAVLHSSCGCGGGIMRPLWLRRSAAFNLNATHSTGIA